MDVKGIGSCRWGWQKSGLDERMCIASAVTACQTLSSGSVVVVA